LPLKLRSQQRLCTLLRTGRLVSALGETICRVRNISSNGFMADICPSLAPGERIALELSEGRTDEAKVIWSQAGRFGAEFLAQKCVAELLGAADRNPRHRHRALRVEPKSGFVTILHGSWAATASIINISQTGMAVFASGLRLLTDTRRDLRLEVDGLDPMMGTLCWSASGAAGIEFKNPLSFETLSHWLWASSLAASSAGPRPLESTLSL
jgi:hypothetical protein